MRNVFVLLAAAILLIPRPSHAQTAALPPAPAQPSDDPRIFFDINMFGTAQSLSKSREFRSEFLAFSELASAKATYPKPSRAEFPLFEIGGGFMFKRSFGLAASYARTVYEDPADLAATIPDPEFLNAAKTGTGATGSSLSRKEGAVHVSMVFVPYRTNRTRWRLLGGPSFFSYSADMVQDVSYVSDLARPQTAITITGFSTSEANASTVGVHVGGDFEYVLTRLFGVTAGARYDYGTVTIDREPLSAVEQRIRVGSTRVVFGVRFHPGK
jgi:hypothetical protein